MYIGPSRGGRAPGQLTTRRRIRTQQLYKSKQRRAAPPGLKDAPAYLALVEAGGGCDRVGLETLDYLRHP